MAPQLPTARPPPSSFPTPWRSGPAPTLEQFAQAR